LFSISGTKAKRLTAYFFTLEKSSFQKTTIHILPAKNIPLTSTAQDKPMHSRFPSTTNLTTSCQLIFFKDCGSTAMPAHPTLAFIQVEMPRLSKKTQAPN